MSRRARDMETPEQQYVRQQAVAAQQAQDNAARQAARSPETPDHSMWRSMSAAQQGAWLARQLGNEDNAQQLEQIHDRETTPPAPRKRWWQ